MTKKISSNALRQQIIA